jgi:hypothetical protein
MSLSRAHIEAIAAKVGVKVEYRSATDYGVDGTFHPIQVLDKRRIESGYPLDFQAKATINWELDDTHVVYDMEVKTFNDLIERSERPASTPLILILLLLPKNESDWVQLTEAETLLKHCCYWYRVACDAHRDGQAVRVRGSLEKEGKFWVLRAPKGFTVLPSFGD